MRSFDPTPAPAPRVPAGARHGAVIHALSRARKRLEARCLLDRLARDLLLALSLYAAVVLADRLLGLALPLGLWLAGALGGAVLLSLAGTLASRRPDLETAAGFLDGRLGLKERLVTFLFLARRSRTSGRPDPWLELVGDDAARSLEGLSLREVLPPHLPRRGRWIPLPAALALGLVLWLPPLDLAGLRARREARAVMEHEVARRREELRRRIERLAARVEAGRREPLEPLAHLRDGLRRAPRREAGRRTDPPGGGSEAGKKTALVELGRAAEALERARDAAPRRRLEEALDALQRARLKDFGPARDLLSALKEGDLGGAGRELARLGRSLEAASPDTGGGGDPAAPARLARDLRELARRAAGLERLSRALGRAAALLGGLEDPRGALDPLRSAEEELAGLARLRDEDEALAEALDLVRGARDDLARLEICPRCRGLRVGLERGGT